MAAGKDAFAACVAQALRAAGEAGEVRLDPNRFALRLAGPPARSRELKHVHARWHHAAPADRQAIVDAFAARRFGDLIRTSDPDRLTDLDVDPGDLACCGDEDFVWRRCPTCGEIWIECFECDAIHADLGACPQRGGHSLSGHAASHGHACGAMLGPFHADADCDDQLPTAEEVEASGAGRYLVARPS